MRFTDISEGVAGPKNCWPGHRKVGTQPGTGKNAGKRVNKCKKIGEGISDEINPADVGEYDQEGAMAIGQLKTAADAAAELRSILDADENLPEWVQAKITKAVDYLDTARDYMKSKEQGVAEGTVISFHQVTLDRVRNEITDILNGAMQGWDMTDNIADLNSHFTAVQRSGNKTLQQAYSMVRDAADTDPQEQEKAARAALDLLSKKGVAEGMEDELESFDRGVINNMQDNTWLSAERAYFRMIGLQKKKDTRPSEYERIIQRYIGLYDKYKGQQGVAEAGWMSNDKTVSWELGGTRTPTGALGTPYNPMDQERREQDAMDASKRSFKRAELDFEFKREQELEQQRKQSEQGPWYLRIDGKVYRQKGQPKQFTSKKGANGYALAIIKNRPELQGKIMLTKSDQDR